MQILVSVNQTSQAILASQLGAQWIDIKDPSQGSLGAASQEFQQQVLLALLGDPQRLFKSDGYLLGVENSPVSGTSFFGTQVSDGTGFLLSYLV